MEGFKLPGINEATIRAWAGAGFTDLGGFAANRGFLEWLHKVICFWCSVQLPNALDMVMTYVGRSSNHLSELIMVLDQPSQLTGEELLDHLEPYITQRVNEARGLPAVPGLAAQRSTSTPVPSPPATPRCVADASVSDAGVPDVPNVPTPNVPTPSGETPGRLHHASPVTWPVTPGAPRKGGDEDDSGDDSGDDEDDGNGNGDDDDDDDRAVGATPATNRRRAGSDADLVPTTPGKPSQLGKKPVKRERSRSRDRDGGGGGGGGGDARMFGRILEIDGLAGLAMHYNPRRVTRNPTGK
jgi:hypothetical protein